MNETIQKIQRAAEIPADVSIKVPIITMIGFENLTIENYRGILEYTPKIIRIQTKSGQIRIEGYDLQINYYTNIEMEVTGKMNQIEYQSNDIGGVE